MMRREFLGILGGAAAWPVGSRAQQAERVRLVGMLSILGPDDPEAHARRTVFEQTLQQLGWTVGRDLKIETRQIGGDVDSLRRYAAELVALAPDVIFSAGSLTAASLQQATRTIPIVFMNVTDPVGAGLVESMAHPGGNITGFSNFEYSISGKWAELLKQIAPNVTRAWCFVIPPLRLALDNSQLFDRWRSPLVLSSRRGTCATPTKSSVPWRHSHVREMAASS
jgi:ABC-type uncharacterized transport system substrate-binding protein